MDTIPPCILLKNGDMSQATLTSSTWNILGFNGIGLEFFFTGTPTGTFAVNVSMDPTNSSLWVPLTLSSSPVASGSAGQIFINLADIKAPYMQIVYTRSSGSGTLNIMGSAKTV